MLEAFGDIVFGVGDAAQHAKVRIGTRNEFMKSPHHPGLRILSANLDVGSCHHQLGLAHQTLDALLQFSITFPVLEALVGQNTLDRLLLGDRDVLANVFLSPLVHEDVAHQAFIRQASRPAVRPGPCSASAGWLRFRHFHGTG